MENTITNPAITSHLSRPRAFAALTATAMWDKPAFATAVPITGVTVAGVTLAVGADAAVRGTGVRVAAPQGAPPRENRR